MHALAMQAGWRPLAHDAWTRVAQGISTVEEVLRVVEGA
jgi:type II secretory ATPase GspE/PulE/Tfp pilus assembly ATPase PilB-like protein